MLSLSNLNAILNAAEFSDLVYYCSALLCPTGIIRPYVVVEIQSLLLVKLGYNNARINNVISRKLVLK